MKCHEALVVFALVGISIAVSLPVTAGKRGGGRYPMYLSKIYGRVEIKVEKPGSRWQPAKRGDLLGGPYLLRTGSHSYVHLYHKFRCVDANSLIRINFDSEASINVLKGRMSAVDGKHGPALPDIY